MQHPVPSDPDCILAHANQQLDDAKLHTQMAKAEKPYGNGHAADRIVDALMSATRQPIAAPLRHAARPHHAAGYPTASPAPIGRARALTNSSS